VSSRCHGRFVGSQLIEVVEPYPAPRSLLTLDRTAVPAGQVVTSAAASAPPAARWPRWTASRSTCTWIGAPRARASPPTVTIPSTAVPGPTHAAGRLRRRLGRDHRTAGPGSLATQQNVQLLHDKVSNVLLDGIAVSASGVRQYELRGNHALRNEQVGIHLGEKTDDALLVNNTARGNGVLDCQDESPPGEGTVGDGTAGTENTWRNNLGPNDDPDGICHEHRKKQNHHHKRKHHKKKRHRPDPCGCQVSPWRLGV
jgi:hypothetical protein